MGLCLSSRKREKKPVRVLMLGFDGAGKTTILYQLKYGRMMSTVPTVGFNIETIRMSSDDGGGEKYWVIDVGGHEKIRPLWKHYGCKIEKLIFVVDARRLLEDPDHAESVHHTLQETVNNRNEFEHVNRVLIYANKMDLPEAMSPGDVVEKLRLSTIFKRRHSWRVQPCSGLTGDGLITGLQYLRHEHR